ncbi:MAG: hypothetical protein M1327_00910 [Candidatus Thermoplasmatota archaeon]|nr:hypothetical protein [Candidatus Thermoplasmatota archaeon]
MPESKFTAKKILSASKTFTDRVEPVSIFNTHLSSVMEGKTKQRALVFYGVGGVGKTRLITELMTKIENPSLNAKTNSRKEIVLLHISMDIHEYDSPLAALIGLRKQLKTPCVLFDYALARYLSLIGKSADQIREFIPKDSVWWDVLGELLSVVHLPIGLLDRIIVWARERHSEQFSLYKGEIDEIDSILHDPSAISERLPHFLGLDISVISRAKNQTFVVFLDSYESIFKRSTYNEGNSQPDEFVRELLISSENTLFVIGSREYLKWGELDPTWDEILDQHILEYLSPEDSEYFLRSVSITDDSIIKSIVNTCKGLPLYLDLCVEIYRRNDPAKLNASDFLIPTKEIITRFLNHLSDNERDLVVALSYVHFFNFDLFERIVKMLNSPVSITDFEEIIDHSFVKRLEDLNGIFKIHDNFYEYVTKDPKMSKIVIGRLMRTAMEYLRENMDEIDVQTLTTMYSSFMRLVPLAGNVSADAMESVLGVSIFLIDEGYWTLVENSLSDLGNNMASLPQFAFLKAVCLRRTGALNESNSMLIGLEKNRSDFGYYKNYVDYYIADVTRVMGNYDAALGIFKNIAANLTSSQDLKLFLKTQRQIGDLTFVKSDFGEALKILQETSAICEAESLELAEVLRIMGHIYRFNFFLEDATSFYMRALEIAKKSGAISLEGRLYNNLTEVFCWIDQKKALDFGDKSISINRAIVSPVEEGKTLAALAIANAFDDNFDKAVKLAKESERIQQNVGYRGGVLFANLALGMVYALTDDQSLLEPQIERASNILSELEGEKFSILPLNVLSKKTKDLEQLKLKCKWLDFDRTLRQLQELFEKKR